LSIKKILFISNEVNKWIGKIISFSLIIITSITMYEVVARYFFKSPTIWVWDLNIQIFAFLVLLTGGYTMAENGHISIDVLVNKLSPKKRAIVDIFNSLFIFLFIGVVLWYGAEMAIESWQRREVMPTIWEPPMYTIRIYIPIGAFLLLIQVLSKFVSDILVLFERQDVTIKDGPNATDN
jgi:TRAP-type mannitol/chloroaromatic compound transport system permease small subunit